MKQYSKIRDRQVFFDMVWGGLFVPICLRIMSSFRVGCVMFVFSLLLPLCAGADDVTPTVLPQAKEVLQHMFTAVDAVQDYEVVMNKQQRHDGKLQPLEVLRIKHRRSPDCRYMNWIGDLHRGREMIYCPARYDGKIEAHDGGLMSIFTVSLDPNGSIATKGQLHRIYETGLFVLAQTVHGDFDYLDAHPELPPPTLSQRSVEDQPSTCVELDRGSDPFKTYHVGRRELCVDEKVSLPTELRLWNTDGDLMEHYVYSQYRLNIGLTDSDFDTHNRSYRY